VDEEDQKRRPGDVRRRTEGWREGKMDRKRMERGTEDGEAESELHATSHGSATLPDQILITSCVEALDRPESSSNGLPPPSLDSPPPLPPSLSCCSHQELPALTPSQSAGWEPLQPWETLPVVVRPRSCITSFLPSQPHQHPSLLLSASPQDPWTYT